MKTKQPAGAGRSLASFEVEGRQWTPTEIKARRSKQGTVPSKRSRRTHEQIAELKKGVSPTR
jgi:hypothetical protein